MNQVHLASAVIGYTTQVASVGLGTAVVVRWG